MKIYVLDFEEVLKNYVGYHQSLNSINVKKEEFSKKIEDIKTEMEKLIKSASSIILDEKTKELNTRRFKELQQQGMLVESEFRATIGEYQNSELEKNFAEVTELVNGWVSDEKTKVNNDIDLIINKNQTVFVKQDYDVTTLFIDYLKTKNLYQEYVEPTNVEVNE